LSDLRLDVTLLKRILVAIAVDTGEDIGHFR
jgi:hypothetical protein